MAKVYGGKRIKDAEGGSDVLVVVVDDNGARPLPLRLDLYEHSPTGFEWGYAGSGPAQLALAICADALGDDRRAERWHQHVKSALVATIDADEWTISAREVCELVRDYEKFESA